MVRMVKTSAAIVAALAAGAAGAQPAALVMDADGVANVELFEEFEAGREIELGSGRLSVMHYANCEEIEVRGGRVMIGETDIEVNDGEILKQRVLPCPEEVQLADTGQVGGVVLRSGAVADLRVNLAPVFVARGTPVVAVELRRDDEKIVLIESGRRFVLPQDQPMLAVGQYEAVMMDADGAVIRTMTIEADHAGQASRYVILRSS